MLSWEMIQDGVEPCPYFDDRRARLPLHLPNRPLTTAEFEQQLAEGKRRVGPLFYKPECDECQACIPLKVDIQALHYSKSLRRVKRLADSRFKVRLGYPVADDEHLALFEKHGRLRKLHGDRTTSLADYQNIYVQSSVQTLEISFRDSSGALAAASIIDIAENSLSAVYTYFDPEVTQVSLGTASILNQIELGKRLGYRWLYLGLWIKDHPHMDYKARFFPHEQRLNGEWVRFEQPDRAPSKGK